MRATVRPWLLSLSGQHLLLQLLRDKRPDPAFPAKDQKRRVSDDLCRLRVRHTRACRLRMQEEDTRLVAVAANNSKSNTVNQPKPIVCYLQSVAPSSLSIFVSVEKCMLRCWRKPKFVQIGGEVR